MVKAPLNDPRHRELLETLQGQSSGPILTEDQKIEAMRIEVPLMRGGNSRNGLERIRNN